MACFEAVNFTITIFWRSVSGNGQATDVLGNNYTITDLIPGVMYNIKLVAVGGGVMSDSTSISISTSTLSSCKYIVIIMKSIHINPLKGNEA